jgi:GNAT superfamily N-acetyltransferase
VKAGKTTAKLRLLLVEPSARGTGLGRRLVDECIAFSRAKGYRKLVLWTHSHLTAARAIYRKAGFKRLPRTEAHDTFGPRAVSEFWELKL